LNVQVFAETKYANLTYEATMDYTKYDQGWIVDNVSWIVKTQDVRCPEIDEMTGCVKSYLSTHEYYRDDWFADSQVAMDNLTIEKSDAVNNEDFIVELNWTSIQKLKHGEKWYSFNSLWKYDDINDNWTLLPDDEDWYHFDSKLISFSPDYTLDFSGEWSYLNQGTLVIENFSWDGFDLRIAELSDPAERFEYEKKDYDFSSRTYLGDDSSVRFNFYEEYTEILWHGNPYYVYARVSEDLPKLS